MGADLWRTTCAEPFDVERQISNAGEPLHGSNYPAPGACRRLGRRGGRAARREGLRPRYSALPAKPTRLCKHSYRAKSTASCGRQQTARGAALLPGGARPGLPSAPPPPPRPHAGRSAESISDPAALGAPAGLSGWQRRWETRSAAEGVRAEAHLSTCFTWAPDPARRWRQCDCQAEHFCPCSRTATPELSSDSPLIHPRAFGSRPQNSESHVLGWIFGNISSQK